MADIQMDIREFILTQTNSRNLSMREFSRAAGVSHATLARVMDGQTPTLEFLSKIARYTQVPLGTLAELSYPDVVSSKNAETLAIAKMIEQLPDNLRDAVLAIIRSRVN